MNEIRFALLALATVAGFDLFASAAKGQDEPTAVAIQVGIDGKLILQIVDSRTTSVRIGQQALVVWAVGPRDHWRVVNGPWTVPETSLADDLPPVIDGLVRGTRMVSTGEPTLLAASLPQLVEPALFRGWKLLSPANRETILFPQTFFRRGRGNDSDTFPAATAVVSRDGEEVVRVPFPEGVESVAWSDLQGLSDNLRNGLPAGNYTIKATTGLGVSTSTFTVETDKRRKEILAPVAPLAELVGGTDSPVYVLAAVECLLAAPEGPYLSDILSLIDSVAPDRRSPHLIALRTAVLNSLQDPGGIQKAAPTDAPTGDDMIDEVRNLIASARWTEALRNLDKALANESPVRRRGLARLYRGVVLAEAGLGRAEETQAEFRSALAVLEGGASADLYRARLNFGNYLASQTVDRLNNQAFRLAAGVPNPVSTSLVFWGMARDEYTAVALLAETLGPSEQAVSAVNLARLHVVLADLLRTFRIEGDGGDFAGECANAATTDAGELCDRAEKLTDGRKDSLLVRALCAELRSHLSYRAGRWDDARREATQARDGYVLAGSLPGLESAYRLTGLIERDAKAEDPAMRKKAMDALLVSYHIGEMLRARYATDAAGQARAGFLARRAYVHGQLVELNLAAERDAEALTYVERARARSLQDLLSTSGLPQLDRSPPRDVAAILATWPKDVVALEYYLGEDKAWVFVIDPLGCLKAFQLVDSKGRSVTPTEIVQRVRRFIQVTDHVLAKEKNRVLALQYDHGWQQDLHDLYRILIPPEAATAIKKSKTAVIAPQHLLHYLPFAALVTEPDLQRSTSEVPRPKFLVEEGAAIIQVPSLMVWDRLRQAPAARITEVRALGDADASGLPGVAQDFANLKEVFGTRTKVIHSSTDATVANAKAMLGQPGLAFFGSHGQESPDRPLEGRIIFEAPSPGNEKGFLTAADIYTLPVASDLVILAACYSGRADRSPLPGDDLFGLQRALLQSGARTVVGGLWDVYDGKAPELMNGLFQRLDKGEPTAEALAGAQREFIKKYRDLPEPRRYFTHPYFWAVYAAWGDERTTSGQR